MVIKMNWSDAITPLIKQTEVNYGLPLTKQEIYIPIPRITKDEDQFLNEIYELDEMEEIVTIQERIAKIILTLGILVVGGIIYEALHKPKQQLDLLKFENLVEIVEDEGN
jgi:hypothetical protein